MILALNCGFYNTKVKTLTTKDIHPTRVQINDNGTRTLIINDVSYEVGNGARDITDKSLSTVHQICTEYNILKHCTDIEIKLVVALPMSRYLDKDYRERYRIGLIGAHVGVVDGVHKKVEVTECTVFAEGAAAYLPYKSILKDKVVGILDFGGATINCMIYSNGQLLKDTITTLDLGMIRLERTLIDAINIATGWNVQDYEIKEIIKNGECQDVVEKCIYEHLEVIKQRLHEKKWNTDRLTLFCTGGGSVQLKDYLESYFKRVFVSKEGIWDNVEGLWLVGRELYEEKYKHN